MSLDFSEWPSESLRSGVWLIESTRPAILALLTMITLVLGLMIGGAGVRLRRIGWSSLGLVFTGIALPAAWATTISPEFVRASPWWSVLGMILLLIVILALFAQAVKHLHLVRRS